VPHPQGNSSKAGLKAAFAAKKAQQMADMRRVLAAKDIKMQHEIRRGIRDQMVKADAKARAEQERRLKNIDDTQATFVVEMDDLLTRTASNEVMKRKEILNLWTEKVYDRIQTQISNKVGAVEKQELSDRLHQKFAEYIEIVNKKDIFRDVVIESEYDPFDMKDQVLKIDARPKGALNRDGIEDPLSEQIAKVLERHEGREHELKSGGRNGLPITKWDKTEVEPSVGFGAKIYEDSLKPPNPKDAERGRVLRGKSDETAATFDHYDYVRGKIGAAVARCEAPLGKRTYPEQAMVGSATFTTTNEVFRDQSGLGALQKEKTVNSQAPFAQEHTPIPQPATDICD